MNKMAHGVLFTAILFATGVVQSASAHSHSSVARGYYHYLRERHPVARPAIQDWDVPASAPSAAALGNSH